MTQKAKRVAVIEGLFTMDDEEPRLIGTKCKSCETYYFPQAVSCCNPDCKEKEIEQCFLSRRGHLWSYTIQNYAPPPPFKSSVPYIPHGIGVIELPEKIRVVGMLTESDPEKLKIGMEMELILGKLYEEDGKEVVTWKFKPI